MNLLRIAILSLVPALAWADGGASFELRVVGVYRPVELEGRFVETPREVYLQAVPESDAELAPLVGRELTVHRRVPVPAAVPMGPPPEAPAAEPTDAAPEEVRVATPPPVQSAQIEVEVGRLRVVGVRGGVAVARVLDREIGTRVEQTPEEKRQQTAAGDRWVELPTVLVGDLARLVVTPAPPAPPPPLTAEERQRLDAERQRLDRDLRRRDARRPKYERKVMKWRL